MNKIYYSVFDAIERVVGNRICREDSGWGRLVISMKTILQKRGIVFVDSPHEAELEFYVGQPPFYLKPQMHPAVTLSMFETTELPRSWVNSFNKWDAIINPSKWGANCFVQSGVRVPIHIVPLPVDFDKFAYVERQPDCLWTFITQGVQLLDRKRTMFVAELFDADKMPSDTELIVKTVPRRTSQSLNIRISKQVRLVQSILPFADYYELLKEAHVSVNPSSGEGFSYLAAESMATGLCTLMTDFSAHQDLLNNDCTIPLKCSVSPTDLFLTGGMDAKVDLNDLLSKMLWTYENQDKALAMGKTSSEWIRKYCDENRIVQKIVAIFDELIEQMPRQISPYRKTDLDEEWIDWKALERSFA